MEKQRILRVLQPITALKSICVKKGFPRSFRVNKTLGYFGLRPSALASQSEATKMEKCDFNIAMETLNEVSIEFP